MGNPAAQTAAAVAFLDGLHRRGDRAVISDLVVSETYYALQYHYGVSKADALASLASLLSTGEISATGEAGAVLAQAGLATAKPGFLDRLIHAGYAKAGAAMATFENAGRKLRNVTVLK